MTSLASIKVTRLVVRVSLHQSKIFFQDDPHVHILLQLAANYLFHVDHLPVLEPHAFGKSWVLIVEVLVAVQGNVGQPANLLSAGPAEHCKVLVSHMHLDLERLILLNLSS